jgi:hypothetical protein
MDQDALLGIGWVLLRQPYHDIQMFGEIPCIMIPEFYRPCERVDVPAAD